MCQDIAEYQAHEKHNYFTNIAFIFPIPTPDLVHQV